MDVLKRRGRAIVRAGAACLLGWSAVQAAPPPESLRPILPEQRKLSLTVPEQLRPEPLPPTLPPNTVSNLPDAKPLRPLRLDDAIRIGLINGRVVRILGSFSSIGSGSTVYDPAIANTQIDQNRGRFDPNVTWNNVYNRLDSPIAILDAGSPDGARILGTESDNYNMLFGLTKANAFGGQAALNVDVNALDSTAPLSALDPQFPNNTQLTYTQPLLRGAGRRANLATIYIARINTSRSFFQLKDSVQRSVESVIQGYWQLVAARVDLWARRQQVEQGEEAVKIAEARLRLGRGNNGPLLQAQTALANFRATLIASQATLLEREALIRNALGLAQSDEVFIVPMTPPLRQKVNVDWDAVQDMAATYRPDLIELKLVLEADIQNLYVARNNNLPRLDATGGYRWNGLEGRTPARTYLRTADGQFQDWSMGVNFSVPLGLRSARAGVRQSQLLLVRDRANIEQALHNASHLLSQNIRAIEQQYAQYRAFSEVRRAARENLDRQLAFFRIGGTRNEQVIYLNVLQAITDWGNAVSSEAQALAQYNASLATLDLNTGTILERHGIRFFEEKSGFLGPLGTLGEKVCYPSAMAPGANTDRYPEGDRPSEETFDLQRPLEAKDGGKQPALPGDQAPETPDMEELFPEGFPGSPQRGPLLPRTNGLSDPLGATPVVPGAELAPPFPREAIPPNLAPAETPPAKNDRRIPRPRVPGLPGPVLGEPRGNLLIPDTEAPPEPNT